MYVVMHKYASRTQAELEAQEYSKEHSCTVYTIKLADGRYGNCVTQDLDDADRNSAMAKYRNGIQIY